MSSANSNDAIVVAGKDKRKRHFAREGKFSWFPNAVGSKVKLMMYGFGDSAHPRQDSADTVEDLVTDYLLELVFYLTSIPIAFLIAFTGSKTCA